MNRIGTVLVFKPGVTRESAAAALQGLEALLDPYGTLTQMRRWKDGQGAVNAVLAADGKHVLTTIEDFDDDHGGPVWYVP